MTIILRLQGLNVKAGTEDIRTFFEHLHIPDGGVFIVGGKLREAFIAFTSAKDAQLAMRFTGKFLKGSKVSLHISSLAETEHKLKSLLKRKKTSPTPRAVQKHPDANVLPSNASPPNTANLPPPTGRPLGPSTAELPKPLHPDNSNLQTLNANSLDTNTAFILGVCTVLQGLQSTLQRQNNDPVPTGDLPKTDNTVVLDPRTSRQTLDTGPGYVRLFGLPTSTTKEVICHFFEGLTVQEAIVNVELGRSHACLVKFADMQDASDALLFNQKPLGSICVEVRAATEKMWTSALQECMLKKDKIKYFDVENNVQPMQNPLRETANQKQKDPSALQVKRRSVHQSPSKAPKKPRPNSDSTAVLSPTVEYTVMVRNLPKNMTKTEIKELLGCPHLAHNHVLHLLDKEGNRTDTAFLFFKRTEDYDYAMNLSGCHVGSDAIEVSSITKTMMRDMMAETLPRSLKQCPKMLRKKRPNGTRLHPVGTKESPSMSADQAAQACLFVRNMPADVQKNQIKMLFSKYKLRKDNIILLHGSNGKGIGEAVVQFKSPQLAALAQRLHGQHFLGTEVLLSHINVKQMEDILIRNAWGSGLIWN